MVRSLADRTFQLRPELPADAATIRRLLAVIEREILPLTRVEVAERGNKVFGAAVLDAAYETAAAYDDKNV